MEIAPGAQDLFEAWEGSNQVRSYICLVEISFIYHVILEANVFGYAFCFRPLFSGGVALVPLYVSFTWPSDRQNAVGPSVDAPDSLQSQWITQ